MCKSGTQKTSEKLAVESQRQQLEAQKQQAEANRYMMEIMRELTDSAKEREARELAYLEGKVDPLLDRYATKGFAEGEREILRNVMREDTSRTWQQAERRALQQMGTQGYSSDAPSGVRPFIGTQLAMGRAEDTSRGYRDIEMMGAQTRRNTLPLMLNRAGMYTPISYYGAAQSSRPGTVQNAQQANIQPGFWQKLGDAAITAGVGGLTSWATGFLPKTPAEKKT